MHVIPSLRTARPIWVFCDGTSKNAARNDDPAHHINMWRLHKRLTKDAPPIYKSGVGTNIPEDATQWAKWLSDRVHSGNGTGE
jgi:hypothetical protein